MYLKGTARWLSWLERRPVTAEVVGSSPIRVVFYGILAQLGEHLPYKQNVSGSIPLAPTISQLNTARWFSWLECRPVTAEVVGSSPIRVAIASVAQLVEQRTENPCVHSSILC